MDSRKNGVYPACTSDWPRVLGTSGVIMLLVMGNAYFVGSEVALTAARRSRIKQLADTGNKSAKYLQILHNEPERFYSVTQTGITMVSMGLSAIGVATIEHLVDPWFEAASHWFGEGRW